MSGRTESTKYQKRHPFNQFLTTRFVELARFPYIGRPRDEDFGPGYRSLAEGEYVIVYCVKNEDALSFTLCVADAAEALFGH